MNPESFPVERYLARIGLAQPPSVDLIGLTTLMRAQLFSVPFENLCVQAGRGISLEPEAILAKILDDQRGGYCYEVNGLFAMALDALGFSYRILGARPMFYPTRRAKTHMVIAVNLAGESYLCDTGFGSYGLRAPLLMKVTSEGVNQDWDTFRLQQLNPREMALQAWVESAWQNQYSFDDYAMEMLDFGPANYFNSHHPDAIFVQKLLVVQHTPDARRVLLDNTLKTITAQKIFLQDFTDTPRDTLVKELFNLAWPNK